jgi:amino acid adenylation domain-containing protein
MSNPSKSVRTTAPDQETIEAKCLHRSGSFIDFKRKEIEQSVPDRFEAIVRQYPNRTAVKEGDLTLTYDELNRAANVIAHAILEQTGSGNEPIALLFEHGIDVITAIIGVLKAGKCYVALDPSFPTERNSYILEDSQARAIVTNTRNANLARALAHDSFVLLNIDEIDDAVSSDNLELCISPDDAAVIVYTSGSTGIPKGVVQSQRILLYYGATYAGRLCTICDDRFTLLHSVSFASAEVHLYRSLLTGGTLFPFDLKAESIRRLADWLEEEQITICHLPPAAFRQLADALSDQQKLSNLRVVHLSGAPITQWDFELYRTRLPAETLFAFHMGSTEAAGICSALTDRSFSFPSAGAPIGYPYPGKRILLLDERGQEVRPGEVGEIAVKSRYLAAGYWRRPDLTRSKFLPDPDRDGERTYRTGDLGQMLPDGFLIHLGRTDSMVKIRGYRVEPAEIEDALLSHADLARSIWRRMWFRDIMIRPRSTSCMTS